MSGTMSKSEFELSRSNVCGLDTLLLSVPVAVLFFLDIPLLDCLSLFGRIVPDWVSLPSPPPTSPAWTAEAGGDVDMDMTSLSAKPLPFGVSVVTLGVRMPAAVFSNDLSSENSTSLIVVGGLFTPGSLANPPRVLVFLEGFGGWSWELVFLVTSF
jgi:hypothetical protein